MVVTFLTSPYYSVSAQNLDDTRLGKQCVEAFQILNVLDDLHFVAKRLGLPSCPPVDRSRLYKQNEWVKMVWNAYKNFPYRYYYCNGMVMKCEKNNLFFTLDKTYIPDKDYSISDSNSVVDKITVLMTPSDFRKYYDSKYSDKNRVEMTFDRCDVIIKEHGDRVIKLGYANHPATRMWLTYENSLVAYLNAHLDEYRRRNGKDMNIPRYKVENEVRPWWIKRDLIISHQASLFRKKKVYYRDVFNITDKYHKHGYIWPAFLSKELAEDLFNENYNELLFSPVNNKIQAKDEE